MKADCKGAICQLDNTLIVAVALSACRKITMELSELRISDPLFRKECSKQKRYEDEVIRCLDGQSRFSEEMLARLIAEAETEVRQAKEEYAELLRNDTTRATIQQIRSYYDEFLGWANEFDLATIPRKRAILGQLIEKVEVGKGYKVTVHLRMSYAQFLGIEGNGEIQVRKDVCA